MRRHYKEQSFNAVKGNNRYLSKKHTEHINALGRESDNFKYLSWG